MIVLKIARGTLEDVLVQADRAWRVWPAWAVRRHRVSPTGITAMNDLQLVSQRATDPSGKLDEHISAAA
jgi:hypothetical protein